MLKLSSKKILLILLAIFILGITFRFLSVLSFPDSQTILQKGELFKLSAGNSLTQTFIANRDDLMKIDFLMRTPGPKDGDVINMQLADASCENIIRQGVLEKAFLNADNLYDFQFAKISDSNGQTYCLKTTFESKGAVSKFIRFFMTPNQDANSVLTDNATGNKIENQSLSMRLAYTNSNFLQSMDELNQRISQYKPWFLKHYCLGTLSFLFIVLSVGLVVILIFI